MRDLLARTIGPTVQVRARLMPGLWPALVDPTQIEIAVLNLAINARDAMPLGGTLTIETRNIDGAAGAAPDEIAGRDCICLSVRDTGGGMTEEVRLSAVEPFFTTKELGKGSGLGLSQVYGVMRQSNGALEIESRVGAGTAVHLYLPRTNPAPEQSATQPEADKRAGAGGRVLVVDDDAAVRAVTAEMLRQIGYGVAEAASGQAALDALARGEIYELVIVDIAMPGLNGIETVRRARERWPGLRVLYVTGYADAAVTGVETDDDPLIRKPFRMSELATAVNRALERNRYAESRNVVPLGRDSRKGRKLRDTR
jgi:CheY-like chemotaxis protein